MRARRRSRRSLALALLAVPAVAACESTRHGDLAQLYRPRAVVSQRPPLVVIPGVMGSRLIGPRGREVWPGSLLDLLSARSFRALAMAPTVVVPAGPQLVARGFFDQLGGRSFYADLVDALEDYGGYRCRPPEEIEAATDCVLLAWDWRQDLTVASRRLEQVVEKLRVARLDPALRVDVVAHSAGGLVARYYLRYGGRDVLDIDELPVPDPEVHGLDRLVLIGTPNFGSIAAVQQAMYGRRFPLGRAGPEVLGTFPGLPQLFPHPRLDWMIERDGLPSRLDLFSLATWRDNQVGLFAPSAERRLAQRFRDPAELKRYRSALVSGFERALARGARFQRALAIPLLESRAEIYVFGSGCELTPGRCLVERENGRLALRRRPEEIRHPLAGIDYRARMLEPGDGSVTKSSLLGLPSLVDGRPGPPVIATTAAIFVCAPHEALSSDPTFLDNLLHVLLYRAAPPRPRP